MTEIDLNKLNKEQRQAVTHGDGPLLIVAGAGTGKTTVITQRINWLIQERKMQSDQILALTFTEKAAGEMEERVDIALPYGYVDLWISTFHAFCDRILKQHAIDIGLPADFKLLDQTQSWLLIKKNLHRFELDYYKPMGNPTKFIHALIGHFSRCKDEEIYPEDYLGYAEDLKINLDEMESVHGKGKKKKVELEDKELKSQEINRLNEVAEAYHIYQQLLLENNSLDFGDLINYTLKLFKTRPSILKKYSEQFKYILVDEFQDTNWAQYELIKLLARPNNNITVVGDDDQSIYKFRGASVSNILNFKKDYPEAKEIFLNTNYRSSQNILDKAYKFIQLNNPERLEVKLGGNNKFTKKLKSQDQKLGLIKYEFLPSLDMEVEYIADEIIKLKEKNKDLLWNDFVILVRANDSANDFTREFDQRQIPYQFFASRGLYYKPIILDILNYLRLLDDYRESPALYRILNLPILKLESYDIVNLNYWAKRRQWSLFEVLKNVQAIPNVKEEVVKEINKLLPWIAKHTKLAQEKSVWNVIIEFLQDSNYLNHIKGLNPIEAKEQFNYLNQFARKVREFEKSFVDNKVSDFLSEIELELAAGEAGNLIRDIEEGPEAVNILTMHSAKGLEYEYVFIPNLVDKRFPTTTRKNQIELPDELIKDILPEGDVHIQEERRLMYVAITRAKHGLYLTGAEDYGGIRKKKPSQFLYELEFVNKDEKKVEDRRICPEYIKRNNLEGNRVVSNIKYKLPTSFSFSQIKTWQACPLQYKYSYILRIPIKGKFTFSFGSSIHKTLQKFFELAKERINAPQQDLFESKKEKNELPTVEDLLKLYEQSWISDWYNDKAQQLSFKKKGKEAMVRFYEDWGKEKNIIPENLEKGFKLQIGDYTMRGIIDRIDRLSDNTLEIIDYKTGASKDKLTSDTKQQLLIYQMAAEILGDKVSKLTYYYVEDGKKMSFIGKDKDFDKLTRTTLDTIDKIATGDFMQTPSPMICKYCDYNKICEHSQAK